MHTPCSARPAWTAAFALSLAAAAASAAPPTYTLVEVDRGALRPACPALDDAGRVAFAFRDGSSDAQPPDGVAFWSEARALYSQVRSRPGEVLGSLVGLTRGGAAVASQTAGPAADFTGVVQIRPDGRTLTRPPGSTSAMRVTPLAVTPNGAILVDGIVDARDGAFALLPHGRLRYQAIPYLAQIDDLSDSGAAIGGSWVDSEERFDSFWRSPQGVIQRLQRLPDAGAYGQTRAHAINGQDAIVGSTITEDGRIRAMLWDSPTAAPRELAPPPGGEALRCEAYDVNDRIEVVGTCTGPDGRNRSAFYWSSATGMVSLASLLPPEAVAAGAQVLENGCVKINNRGWLAFPLVEAGLLEGAPALLKPVR